MLRNGYSLKLYLHEDNGWYGAEWHGDDFVDYESKEDDEHFEHYYDAAIQFIQNQYIERNRKAHRTVWVHVVAMTDGDNMEKTMCDISNMITRAYIRNHSLFS